MIPKEIILHHTAGGTLKGAEETLKKRGLSYHYMIDTDGSIHEYVKPNVKALHAYRHNDDTVGIAYVGGGKFGPINSQQYHSLVVLMKELVDQYPSITAFSGHKHVDPRGWKIDPRWPGEPADGVNWSIDKEHMERLSALVGLDYFVCRRSLKVT